MVAFPQCFIGSRVRIKNKSPTLTREGCENRRWRRRRRNPRVPTLEIERFYFRTRSTCLSVLADVSERMPSTREARFSTVLFSQLCTINSAVSPSFTVSIINRGDRTPLLVVICHPHIRIIAIATTPTAHLPSTSCRIHNALRNGTYLHRTENYFL